MGFLKPNLPTLDMATWNTYPRHEKIRRMAAHWAEFGAGTPTAMHLFYAFKIGLYILGGWLVVLSTPGIDGFTHVGEWWREPIVFEKAVIYTLLFEVVGLGCSFGPLNSRIFPPLGSVLYWLRPNTIRLPPWPGRIPLTAGTTRTPFDVALYAALLSNCLLAIFSPGSGPIPELHTDIGLLPSWHIATIVGLLAVLGLRDKVIFLAARGEVYGSLSIMFLFGPVNALIGAKLVFLMIWIGAATSKLNHHFPYVMASMMANNPMLPARRLKRSFYRRPPDDLMPSSLARTVAHASTVVEMGVPILLYFAGGGWLTAVAAFVMVVFHLGILTAIPMGVPLEWNVFMIFGVFTLFVAHPGLGVTDLTNPVPVALVLAVLITCVIIGNLAPRKVCFLWGMRYYAGNWDTSLWCYLPSAQKKMAINLVAIPYMPQAQREKLYGSPEMVEISTHLGFAFRALFATGRGYFTLLNRVLPPDRADEYEFEDGERIATLALGWNFGDGHFHNEQLVAALHERCHFEPGEVRVVMIDGQPLHRQRLEYRLVDAATGEFESGHFNVADLIARQPWQHDVPLHVHDRDRSEAR